MSTSCQLVFVREEAGRFIHQCQACGQEYRSVYSDPAKFKAQCRVKKRMAEHQPESGPGTELKSLIGELGLAALGCAGCDALASSMDRWGVAGCRERREEIILDIRARAAQVGWWEKSKAALAAIRTDWWNPLDNIGSLVDEAIRRAEQKT